MKRFEELQISPESGLSFGIIAAVKKDKTSYSESWLSGLSTPLLGFVALLATFYTYGAVQNWSFVEAQNLNNNLKWERDFVDHLDKCLHPPSSLEICDRAFKKTVLWLNSKNQASQLAHPRFSLPSQTVVSEPVQSLNELRVRAEKFAEQIPVKLESEATLKALNTWLSQIDPYSHFAASSDSTKQSKSWDLFATEKGVSTLKIYNFNSQNMCDEIKAKLKTLQINPQVYALRVDLRGNPGGSVESALCLADLMVPKGSVLARFQKQEVQVPFRLSSAPSGVSGFIQRLREKFRKDNFDRKAYRGMVFAKTIEVIIDRNSASAAEMLAASLKDVRRARIVGERSFGKSSIQVPRNFEDFQGMSALITAYRWLRPSGESISATQGIVPDLNLKL